MKLILASQSPYTVYITLKKVKCICNNPLESIVIGGERGIRTLGTVARTLDFQSSTFGHSVTSPSQNCFD